MRSVSWTCSGFIWGEGVGARRPKWAKVFLGVFFAETRHAVAKARFSRPIRCLARPRHSRMRCARVGRDLFRSLSKGGREWQLPWARARRKRGRAFFLQRRHRDVKSFSCFAPPWRRLAPCLSPIVSCSLFASALNWTVPTPLREEERGGARHGAQAALQFRCKPCSLFL